MVRRFTDVLHYRGVGIASALQAAVLWGFFWW